MKRFTVLLALAGVGVSALLDALVRRGAARPSAADASRNNFLRYAAYGTGMPFLHRMFELGLPDRRRQRLSRWSSALALAAALGILLWLGWAGTGTRAEMRLASQRAVRVAELRGSFAYYDEWRTMSARMAVLSGEPRWVARFEEAGPKLAAAIAEAVALATPEVGSALAITVEEANGDLTAMERAAFALLAGGDRGGARALLDSPEFSYLQAVFASGIEAFGQDLETLATARAKALNDRAWMEMSGLGASALFLVAAIFARKGRVRLRAALATTEAVARTDALTGLPNRRGLYEQLRAALARADRSGGAAALLLCGLDRFKGVNDVHGHAVGDQLLQLAAARLHDAAGVGSTIARLGGDEFALVVPLDAAEPSGPAGEAAAQIARRVIAVLGQPFALQDGPVAQVGVSIGIAFAWGAKDGDADALVRRADVALYQAKADGRGRFHVFDPGLDAHIQARALLEGELRQAIARDALRPYFQPLVDMASGRLIGFEMLARWPHPTRGIVPPGEFIPVAEESGLIGPMTEGLLRRACRAAAAWPPDTFIACNLSPLQLRDRRLPAAVQAILTETGLPPHRLELEITESALVGDVELARDLLGKLKALGVRLALDDFGTGYSSLRHLQLLPIDKLKIDASFVRAMGGDTESRKIVAAVIGLSHSLGLLTVAEGVEDESTAALLRDLGCDVGQGWLYGRPASEEAAGALLFETVRS